MLPTAERIAAHLLALMGIDPRKLRYKLSNDLLVNQKGGATSPRSRATMTRNAKSTASTKTPSTPKPITPKSTTSEPPVGVKAARMPKKDTKAATPAGKAKLFMRP